MNHPNREKWMSYLYDELNPDETANLDAHLHVCPDCAASIKEWQATRRQLDEWRLSTKRARMGSARPMIKWAAAAVVVLSVGVGMGRLTATANVQSVRAAIEPELRRELHQEFTQLLHDELERTSAGTLAASNEQTKHLLAEFAHAVETKQLDDTQAIYATLNKLDSQRVADFTSLRKDLETVALNADWGLRRTEQQLVELADTEQPGDFPNSSK